MATALDFLGKGLRFPLKRDGTNDFANGSGVDLVKDSVKLALLTVGDSPLTSGELPWRTDFGSPLQRVRHQRETDRLREVALVYIEDTLKKWCPRVKNVRVEFLDTTGDSKLSFRIRYDIISENVADNNVVLPGVSEVITL